jgi:hypothetical protein
MDCRRLSQQLIFFFLFLSIASDSNFKQKARALIRKLYSHAVTIFPLSSAASHLIRVWAKNAKKEEKKLGMKKKGLLCESWLTVKNSSREYNFGDWEILLWRIDRSRIWSFAALNEVIVLNFTSSLFTSLVRRHGTPFPHPTATSFNYKQASREWSTFCIGVTSLLSDQCWTAE